MSKFRHNSRLIKFSMVVQKRSKDLYKHLRQEWIFASTFNSSYLSILDVWEVPNSYFSAVNIWSYSGFIKSIDQKTLDYSSRFPCWWLLPSYTNIYLFKANNKNIRKRYEICSKLRTKTTDRRQLRSATLFKKRL